MFFPCPQPVPEVWIRFVSELRIRLIPNLLRCFGGFALILLVGCGAESEYASRPSSASGESDSMGFVPRDDVPRFSSESDTSTVPVEGGDIGSADSSSVESEQFARKLIYTADADLVVEDFDAVPQQIDKLVRQYRGFIANSQIGGRRGSRRTGTWQVRIPAEQFEPFLAATVEIGEVRSLARKSQDVTEEFFDVEARIRNKRVQENGLLKILEERPGKLEDVLTVERELSRVREEMERMEGRLRLLANLTSLTTINIVVEEIKNYFPEQAPTFTRRVARSFEGSMLSLRRTGENLAIALVALLPWVLVLCVLGIPVVWGLRKSLRR